MADDKKKGYPKIPRNNWFLLREKFKQRTPERVSPSYIATALAMGEASASANIIPPLRAFGLIDEAGKPSDLAYDWRDDRKYAEVCKTILEATYPQELRDLFHSADVDFKDVSTWFARSAKVGESAARGYAATYMMLLEADLAKAKEAGSAKPRTTASTTVRAATPAKSAAPARSAKPSVEQKGTAGDRGHGQNDEGDNSKRGFSPQLHVDIQIHISPDSSPEQIDKIFESMAKHLPLKG
ncbi:DUF5343 domain-containing protein [Cognatiluteimonas profundi]|uniref:DUF5343 domain-containing protein n=1 Tax=Cognatiluteimonas profundi TaxID=2594501 RepID=UPI00131ABD13|nr:DUF5343 domain-containing protein [Lysobacter profundi]